MDEGVFGGGDLAVEEDRAVEGAGGEKDSEAGVGPVDAPDGSFVARDSGGENGGSVGGEGVDFGGPVGGGGGEASAVVVEAGVVDHVGVGGAD